jgi:hypothetical protein
MSTNSACAGLDVELVPIGTPGKQHGQRYVARCTVNGRDFCAESTAGASFELARQLVAAGVADRPLVIRDGKFVINVASMHRHAERTMSEGNAAVHVRKFTPYPGSSGSFMAGLVKERPLSESPLPDSLPEPDALYGARRNADEAMLLEEVNPFG